MKNHILRYGIIGGCISVALGILNWFTVARYGPTVSQTFGWIAIVISLMCVPLGIIHFRDKINDGSVSFFGAFKTGFGISLVFSVVTGIYSVVFFLLASDDFDDWRRRGLNEAELQALELQLEQTPAYLLTPLGQGLIFFVMMLLIATVINLVSSLILRKA